MARMNAAPLVIGIGLSLCTLGGVWLYGANRHDWRGAVSRPIAAKDAHDASTRDAPAGSDRFAVIDAPPPQSNGDERVQAGDECPRCILLERRIAQLENELTRREESFVRRDPVTVTGSAAGRLVFEHY